MLIADMQLNHRFITANINFRWKRNRRKKQQGKKKSQQSRPLKGKEQIFFMPAPHLFYDN